MVELTVGKYLAETCEAVSPWTGDWCILYDGHLGSHIIADSGIIRQLWETDT